MYRSERVRDLSRCTKELRAHRWLLLFRPKGRKWGGGQAFRFAENNQVIKLSAPFYGTGPDTKAEAARINSPVYGFYGGNDNRVDATIPKTKEVMKEAGKTYEPVIYDGAGHGFMRAGEAPDANAANKKARDEAWKRLVEKLKSI